MPYSRSCLLAAVAATALLAIPPLRAASPPGFILAADSGVVVQEAWARATPGSVTNGAAYITLAGGSQPDTLVGVSTSVAATADVHETTNTNGVMKMRAVQAIPIPAGQTVTFSPGGYHIMMMGLKQPLIAGHSFPLTLNFARAGAVTVDVQVRGRGHDASTGGHEQMHTQ